jgi:hypothetical protein
MASSRGSLSQDDIKSDAKTFVQKKADEMEEEQYDRPKWSPEM